MGSEFEASFSFDRPYDLESTLTLHSLGHADPCYRVSTNRVDVALLGPEGPVVLSARQDESQLSIHVAGESADWLRPRLPALLGLDFQPPELVQPRRLHLQAKKRSGFRLARAPRLFPQLTRVVLQQLISYHDACDGWRELVRRYGTRLSESSLDGDEQTLYAPPTPQTLSRLASYEFIECGILPEHGRRISALARYADKIESHWDGEPAAAIESTSQLLHKLPGVGPWTLGFLRGFAMGDADAIVPGDYGFPRQVTFFLTGEDRPASDEEMIALLEPYRPHRFYVLALIVKSGIRPPRRGPRAKRLRDRMRPRRR